MFLVRGKLYSLGDNATAIIKGILIEPYLVAFFFKDFIKFCSVVIILSGEILPLNKHRPFAL